jgi:hypothetical protein
MYSASHSEEAEGAAAVSATVSEDWAEAPAAARRARDQTNFMLTVVVGLLIKGLEAWVKMYGTRLEKNGMKSREMDLGRK